MFWIAHGNVSAAAGIENVYCAFLWPKYCFNFIAVVSCCAFIQKLLSTISNFNYHRSHQIPFKNSHVDTST